MSKQMLALAVVTVGVLGLASGALSSGVMTKPIKLKAQLNAAQEVPKQTVKAPAGKGTWTATLTGTSLKWKLTYSKLSGPASQAHVHMGARGKAGNVLISLCTPCNSGASGTATVTAAQKTAILAGKTYVNVHTAKNPNGEIRGQIAKAK